MSETKHTPTPWHYDMSSNILTHTVRGPQMQYIAGLPWDSSGKSESDARLIVRAVNSLPLLREAEEALEGVWSGVTDGRRASLKNQNCVNQDSELVSLPVLWGTLKKISAALARIREAKEKP